MRALRMMGIAAGLIAIGLLLSTWPLVCAKVQTTVSTPPRSAEIAQPTPAAAAAERETVAPELCAGLTEITTPELLAEVARRHALPDLRPRAGSPATGAPSAPGGQDPAGLAAPELRRALLALDQTEQPAPWGVEVAATLAPGETQPLLTVIPREPPRFAWHGARRFELGLGGALAFGEEKTSADPALFLGFTQQFAQTRRVDHGLKVAGIVSRHSTLFAGYVADWH